MPRLTISRAKVRKLKGLGWSDRRIARHLKCSLSGLRLVLRSLCLPTDSKPWIPWRENDERLVEETIDSLAKILGRSSSSVITRYRQQKGLG